MLRFGLFGAGRIGQVHAASLAAHPGTELAAVHDPMHEAASAIAASYGGRVAASAEEVLEDPTVDAVIIGSPTATHVPLLTAAVRAGKAVLCEKPIDLDLARVDRCQAEIEPLGGIVMIGFNRRFDPSIADARARVAAGQIGRLEQLTIVSRDPAPAPAGYIATSGGIFRDMTIHDLDLARFFLGEIVEVQAMAANLVEPYIAAAGDHDSAMLTLRAADGALCQIVNSRRCSYGYDQRLEAFGSEATLTVANQTPTSVHRSDATGTGQGAPYLAFFLDRYAPAYRAELDHLVACMETGTAPSPTFTDGREALALADAANESLRTGAVVRLGG